MGLIYLNTVGHRFSVVPYRIYGISLWAVTRDDGYVERYCDSKHDAETLADQCNQRGE